MFLTSALSALSPFLCPSVLSHIFKTVLHLLPTNSSPRSLSTPHQPSWHPTSTSSLLLPGRLLTSSPIHLPLFPHHGDPLNRPVPRCSLSSLQVYPTPWQSLLSETTPPLTPAPVPCVIHDPSQQQSYTSNWKKNKRQSYVFRSLSASLRPAVLTVCPGKPPDARALAPPRSAIRIRRLHHLVHLHIRRHQRPTA